MEKPWLLSTYLPYPEPLSSISVFGISDPHSESGSWSCSKFAEKLDFAKVFFVWGSMGSGFSL